MVAPVITRKRFTTQEYEQIIAVGVITEDDRVELLDGEIVEMSPIGPSHSACIDRLNRLLQRLVADSAIVRVQSPIRLSRHSEPQPDLTLLQPRDDFYAAGHPEPEDVLLLIEVSESSLSYDRELKLPLYARAGIPEVWIVAPLEQMIEAYRSPKGAGYREKQQLRRGEVLTALNIPEFSLPVENVLG